MSHSEYAYVDDAYVAQLDDLGETLMERYREVHRADNIIVYLNWLRDHGHPGYAQIIEGVGNEGSEESTNPID